MEGYYYAGGASVFPHLDEDHALPRVPSDLDAMTTLLRDRLKLQPISAAWDPLQTPLKVVLQEIQRWNSEPNAPAAALVFYQATHGRFHNNHFHLYQSDSQHRPDGELNTATTISARMIAESLSGGRIKQLLIVLDTCQAGGAVPELHNVFTWEDVHSVKQRGLKIHVIVASRSRQYAVDGAFANAFCQAVEELGSNAPEATFLDLHSIVTTTKRQVDDAQQTVELHEIIDHGGPCRRLPNPTNRHCAESLDACLARLKSIADAHGRRHLEQDWLWYAWHEGGMVSDERQDIEWFQHVRQRASQGLDRGVCPLIRLVEGFAYLEPDIRAKLHVLQEDIVKHRRADLALSRKEGRKRYDSYQQWRESVTLELQIHLRADHFAVVRTVAVQTAQDELGRIYRVRDPLPALHKPSKKTLELIVTEYERAFDLRKGHLPLRILTSNRSLLKIHGRYQYTERKTLAQVTEITLHSAERWGMVDLTDIQRRAWGLARNEMLTRRRTFRDISQILHSDSPAWDAALEDGTPVILVIDKADATAYHPHDWSRWPAQLLFARQETPDLKSVLIYDAPDYAPWNLPMQLSE